MQIACKNGELLLWLCPKTCFQVHRGRQQFIVHSGGIYFRTRGHLRNVAGGHWRRGLQTHPLQVQMHLLGIIILGLNLWHHFLFHWSLRKLDRRMLQLRFCWRQRWGRHLSNFICNLRRFTTLEGCFDVYIDNSRRKTPAPKCGRVCGNTDILPDPGATLGLYIGSGEMLRIPKPRMVIFLLCNCLMPCTSITRIMFKYMLYDDKNLADEERRQLCVRQGGRKKTDLRSSPACYRGDHASLLPHQITKVRCERRTGLRSQLKLCWKNVLRSGSRNKGNFSSNRMTPKCLM